MCKKIEVCVDENLSLTVNKAKQTLELSDIEKQIENFYNGTVTEHVIWDLSNIDRLDLTDDDIKRLAIKTSNYGRLRKGGCNAIVVKEKRAHSLSMAYRMFSENEKTNQKNAVFYSFFEAIGWIQSEEIKNSRQSNFK